MPCFFTLAGNRRRIEDAAAKARAEGIAIGRQEGIAIGRAEALRQARQELAEWYAAAKADLAAGRFPNPPPILVENGNKPDYPPREGIYHVFYLG